MVVILHCQIGDLAVALRCGDPVVTEQILDGGDFRFGVQQLGGHGVAQLVTAGLQSGLFRVVFDAFLDPSNRYGLSLAGAFFH